MVRARIIPLAELEHKVGPSDRLVIQGPALPCAGPAKGAFGILVGTSEKPLQRFKAQRINCEILGQKGHLTVAEACADVVSRD